MGRDISQYEDDYVQLPFEEDQAHLRRIELLKVLHTRQPKSVLEVGCGQLPLFLGYSEYEEMVIVEPGERFASNAARLAESSPNAGRVSVENALFEDAQFDDLEVAKTGFDMIVVSALLHEVEDPEAFMKKAVALGSGRAEYLITVPNENSFHRQLAVRLGLIDATSEKSQQQQILQQFRIFSRTSLDQFLRAVGLVSVESSSMIFKPFTHFQMQSILDHDILTQKQVHAFCGMIDLIDADAGSELLVVAKKA